MEYGVKPESVDPVWSVGLPRNLSSLSMGPKAIMVFCKVIAVGLGSPQIKGVMISGFTGNCIGD